MNTEDTKSAQRAEHPYPRTPAIQDAVLDMATAASSMDQEDLEAGRQGWHLFLCLGALQRGDREGLEWHRDQVFQDLATEDESRERIVRLIDGALAALPAA